MAGLFGFSGSSPWPDTGRQRQEHEMERHLVGVAGLIQELDGLGWPFWVRIVVVASSEILPRRK